MRFSKKTGQSDKTKAASGKATGWCVQILILLAWSACLGVFSLYYAKGSYGTALFRSYLANNSILFLNILPVVIVVFFFFLLSNRAWISMLCSCTLITLITLINYFKLVLRNDPFIASDALLVSEAAKISRGYELHFEPLMLIFALFAAAAVALAFFFLRRRLPPLPRWILLLAVVVTGAAVFSTVYTDRDRYNEIDNLDVKLEGRTMSRWSETDQYVSRGFIYPLLHSVVDIVNTKPQGYDQKTARALLSGYSYEDIPQDQKVSVIAVMLEAYNDFSKFQEIDLIRSPYSFFHRLQKEGVSGELVTNIFAGNTIDTERAFMTGNTVLGEYRSAAESFVRYFKEQGYYTEFCHPGYDWFYNRRNVSEYLGFDASHFYEDRYEIEGSDKLLRDNEFFMDIIKLYKEAVRDGTPYFNFSVTYQNHGPYTTDYLYSENEYTEYIFSHYAFNGLNNYLSGIESTDKAMRRFVGYFEDEANPVVLIFFGDHNPWLGDGASIYLEIGINLELDTAEGFYNYYNTPFVIWANDAAKEALEKDFIGDAGSFSPNFLMPELFSQAGWGGDEFIKASLALRDTIDVIHTTGILRERGELTGSVSGEAGEKLREFDQMQYFRRAGGRAG